MDLKNYIEHTCLKQDATEFDIEKLCQEAIKNEFLGVCVNPNYVDFAHGILKGSGVKLVSVVNFPLGTSPTISTLLQVDGALASGADEIDTVISVSDLKNKNYKNIYLDIKQIKDTVCDKVLKVILETDLLTKEEIVTASKICVDANVDFVKTSTGFVKGGVGATIDNVKLMYDTVSSYGLGVKASGGIKTYDFALKLIKAGATRLGTSSGVDIIKGN